MSPKTKTRMKRQQMTHIVHNVKRSKIFFSTINYQRCRNTILHFYDTSIISFKLGRSDDAEEVNTRKADIRLKFLSPSRT